MKIKYIILLAGVAAFSSCSTAYRSGQTPDDVYYSPAPEVNTYVSTANDRDQNSYSYRNEEGNGTRSGMYNPGYSSPLSLSMGLGYSPYSLYSYNNFYNPYGYNNYGYNNYGYSPYGLKGMYNPYYDDFGYSGLSFYSPYNSYSPYSLGYGYSPYSNGYGYSPYYSPILFSTKSVNTNTGARKYNLNVYNNNATNNTVTSGTEQPIRTETTQPVRGTGVGNVIRRVFTPSQRNTYVAPTNNRTYNNNNERTYNNNRSDNSNQTPQRTFTPSSNTNTQSSSSSSSSGNTAPVRSFRR